MVGSLYDSTVVNQTVLVFCGSQGIGKTTWVLNLIPNKLKDYVFSGYLQPHNKDSILLLSECALINLDELEGLNKGEIDSLKEMITKPQIKVRRPYASSSEVLTRRASFAGSINSHEFLHDYSGNRRFLCFTVNNIQYKHKVDIEKVLAQALYLFQGGFQYWFDQAEIRKVNQQNEAYRVIDIEEELLLKWYKPCNYSNASKILTTAQILQLLYQNAGLSRTNRTLQKIGKILRANDFERIKHKGRYAYCLQQVIG
jgi:predicted P-loop ATPase